MTTVIIGAGYVGRCFAAELTTASKPFFLCSRSPGVGLTVAADGNDLDRVLTAAGNGQVVVTAQLNGSVDWILDRIDGSRWIVLSSAQLKSAYPPATADTALGHEARALDSGACVIRPTMIFGRGQDKNLTRYVRMLLRTRLPVIVGGSQLLQPLHVDDLTAVLRAHSVTRTAGLFEAGGPEQLPVIELVGILRDILGLYCPTIAIPREVFRPVVLRMLSPLANPNAVLRLFEDKVVDNQLAKGVFSWVPAPLGLRLEQLVAEALGQLLDERQQGPTTDYLRQR